MVRNHTCKGLILRKYLTYKINQKFDICWVGAVLIWIYQFLDPNISIFGLKAHYYPSTPSFIKLSYKFADIILRFSYNIVLVYLETWDIATIFRWRYYLCSMVLDLYIIKWNNMMEIFYIGWYIFSGLRDKDVHTIFFVNTVGSIYTCSTL